MQTKIIAAFAVILSHLVGCNVNYNYGWKEVPLESDIRVVERGTLEPFALIKVNNDTTYLISNYQISDKTFGNYEVIDAGFIGSWVMIKK